MKSIIKVAKNSPYFYGVHEHTNMHLLEFLDEEQNLLHIWVHNNSEWSDIKKIFYLEASGDIKSGKFNCRARILNQNHPELPNWMKETVKEISYLYYQQYRLRYVFKEKNKKIIY